MPTEFFVFFFTTFAATGSCLKAFHRSVILRHQDSVISKVEAAFFSRVKEGIPEHGDDGAGDKHLVTGDDPSDIFGTRRLGHTAFIGIVRKLWVIGNISSIIVKEI